MSVNTMSRKLGNRSKVLIATVGAVSGLTAVWAFFTGQVGAWGGLIGFLAGVAQCQWMFLGLQKSMDGDLSLVLARYTKSMVFRWGFVAALLLFIARYFVQGLVFAGMGFALGVVVSNLLAILEMAHKEKKEGGEN